MWSLQGIKVIDMTQNVAGPYTGMILAEFGAEVMKVEPPKGDASRQWGPPFWDNHSPSFLALNRNKLSITLDVKSTEGKGKLVQMLTDADVFLVSSRPGVMARLGLDYEDVQAINSKIIYGEIISFGHKGPRSKDPGYDPLMQALGGIMSVTGHQGEEPVRTGTSTVDMGAGMWLALGILNAVYSREKTGKSYRVTSSLYETAIAWMSILLTSYWASGEEPGKWGSGNAMMAPYEAFPTKDKWLIIAAGNDRLFEKLCEVLGHPEWLSNPKFSSNAVRVTNRKELKELIADITRKESADYWMKKLKEQGIPNAPVLDVAEMSRDPQLLESGIIQSISHPDIKDFKSVGLPILINDKRPALRIHPPR